MTMWAEKHYIEFARRMFRCHARTRKTQQGRGVTVFACFSAWVRSRRLGRTISAKNNLGKNWPDGIQSTKKAPANGASRTGDWAVAINQDR